MKKSYFFLGLSVLWLNQSAFSKSDPFLRPNSAFLAANYPSKALQNLKGNSSEFLLNGDAEKEKISNASKHKPLLFIENKGQLIDNSGKQRPDLLFSAAANGVKVYLSGNSIGYVFSKPVAKPNKVSEATGKIESSDNDGSEFITYRMDVKLVGSNPNPEVVKEVSNPYYENYYLAHCPNGVTANSFEKIRLKNVYAGVDWVIYSNGSGLKYDFELASASAANNIQLEVEGGLASLNKNGGMLLKTPMGSIAEQAPISFQNGKKVTSAFKLNGNTFSFETKGANPKQPLVIDPAISWSTLYSGSNNSTDFASIKLDASGNVIASGSTEDADFPVLSAFQATFAGNKDVAVVKFDGSGNRLWATFYGGANIEAANSSVLGASNSIVVVGNTNSSDFPTSGSTYQATLGGSNDGFILTLNSSGSRTYATYFGSTGDDAINDVTRDATGAVIVVGNIVDAMSGVNASLGSALGSKSGMVAKFNSSMTYQWGRFVGGTGSDEFFGVATNAANQVLVCGSTTSSNFPATPGAFSLTLSGTQDAVMLAFTDAGVAAASTFYGGSGNDVMNDVLIDAGNNIYYVGTTNSNNFPTLNPSQSTFGGNHDVAIIKYSPLGARLAATYFGGNIYENAISAAIDVNGNIYVAGETDGSTGFPSVSALTNPNAGPNGFIAKFNSSLSATFASMIGGTTTNGPILDTYDAVRGVVADAAGNMYLAGFTEANDFPTTSGAFQTAKRGNESRLGFVTKLANCTVPTTPTITAGGATTLCSGGSVVLTASSGTAYLWSNNATTQSITVTQSGQYSVRIIDNGCTSAVSAATQVTVNSALTKPTITDSERGAGTTQISDTSFSICSSGGSIKLESSVAPNGGTYLWSNNATSRSITVTAAGNYTVRVIDGGCTSAVSRTFVITTESCVGFTGTVNNNLSNPANWPGNVLPTAVSNVVLPSNTTFTLTSTFTCTNLTIPNNSVINGSAGSGIIVLGNLYLGGSISGATIACLCGSVPQFIYPIATISDMPASNGAQTASPKGDNSPASAPVQTLANLDVNNSAGATIDAGINLEITNSLSLMQGVLTVATGGQIKFKSNASGTAYIDDFSPGHTGSISGVVKFERYTPAGYRQLSSPISFPTDNMDVFNAACLAIKGFEEPTNTWVPIPSNCQDLSFNDFFSDYGTPVVFSSSPTTLTYTGFALGLKPVFGGSVNYNLKRTASIPNGPARGWNALGNVFSAPLNWLTMKTLGSNATKTNGALWVWNSQLNKWATYSSVGIATNGGSPIIAIGQGFMVRALNSGSSQLLLDTTCFLAQNTSQFLRSGSTNENEIIRFSLNGNKGSDEAVIHLTPFANALEDDNDAERPMSLGGGVSPELSTIAPNGTKMIINALSHAELSEKEMPLSLNVTEAGDYNLVMTENLSDFNVSIFDLKTGVAVPAESGLKISAIEKGEIAGRYFVRVSAKSNTETVNSTFTAWSVGNQEVKVKLADATNTNLEVVNALGQSINFAQEKTSSNEVSLKFSTPQTGILFIRQGGKTEKVSIR